MRTPTLLASLLFVLPLTAQNLVSNGDFANGLVGWSQTGFSINPGVETFDVTGLGAQTCHGANHGGQSFPGPYPPNSIKQSVPVVPGTPLEFSVDVCVNDTSGINNGDAGTFWVTVGGTEIARATFGQYLALEHARARLTTQFVHPTGGNLDLEIFMHRNFISTATTPRVRLTNVQLRIATGPTFTWQNQRRIGQVSTIGGVGTPNAPYGFYVALRRTGGVVIPGFRGTMFLDPVSLARFFSGFFDAQGLSAVSLPVPVNPSLLSAVFFVQGLEVRGGPLFGIGFDQFVQFQ